MWIDYFFMLLCITFTGARVDVQEHYMGSTALIQASRNGHADVVRLLLDAGQCVHPNVSFSFLSIAVSHFINKLSETSISNIIF